MKIEAKGGAREFGVAELWVSYENAGHVFAHRLLSDAARDEFVRLINAGQAALEREVSGIQMLEDDAFDMWEQRRWELFKVVVANVDDRPVASVAITDELIAEFRGEAKA